MPTTDRERAAAHLSGLHNVHGKTAPPPMVIVGFPLLVKLVTTYVLAFPQGRRANFVLAQSNIARHVTYRSLHCLADGYVAGCQDALLLSNLDWNGSTFPVAHWADRGANLTYFL
jgi:hypothetical protein